MHSGGVNKTDTASAAQNDTFNFTPLFVCARGLAADMALDNLCQSFHLAQDTLALFFSSCFPSCGTHPHRQRIHLRHEYLRIVNPVL